MKQGKIYKMYNQYGIYYGSTTKSLKERLKGHERECKSKQKNKCTSKILFQNGAIPKIQLIEEIEFDDIKELRNREAYYIRNLDCINKDIPGRTDKERYLDNKEQITKQKKVYYQKNKEQIVKQKKEYRDANKHIISEKNKLKITCECGSVIRKREFSRHCKTKKHQNFINSQNIVI